MGILTAVNQFNSQKDGVSSEERRSIIRRKMEYHQTLCSRLSLCFICPYSITDHCWCTQILFQTAHHSLCLFCSYSIFLWIRFPECHHVCLYNSLYLLRMLVLAQIKLSHLGRKPLITKLSHLAEDLNDGRLLVAADAVSAEREQGMLSFPAASAAGRASWLCAPAQMSSIEAEQQHLVKWRRGWLLSTYWITYPSLSPFFVLLSSVTFKLLRCLGHVAFKGSVEVVTQ